MDGVRHFSKHFFLSLSFLSLFISYKFRQPLEVLADPNGTPNVGSCMFTIQQEKGIKKEPAFILEVILPKYDTIETKFTSAELEKYLRPNGREYYIPTLPPHLKFVTQNKKLANYTNTVNPVGYMYCSVEVPGKYWFGSSVALAAKYYTLPICRIVEPTKLVKTYVRKKPDNLLEGQYFYERGYWSEPKPVIVITY